MKCSDWLAKDCHAVSTPKRTREILPRPLLVFIRWHKKGLGRGLQDYITISIAMSRCPQSAPAVHSNFELLGTQRSSKWWQNILAPSATRAALFCWRIAIAEQETTPSN